MPLRDYEKQSGCYDYSKPYSYGGKPYYGGQMASTECKWTILALSEYGEGWKLVTTNQWGYKAEDAVKHYYAGTNKPPKNFICFPTSEGRRVSPPHTPDWVSKPL